MFASGAMSGSGVDGRMYHFCDEDKNLIAFISLDQKQELCENALLLIPGLTDGFMSLPYTPRLSSSFLQLGYSVVQMQISSSFMQFGFSSIQKDCQELTKLIKFLREELNFKNIALLGHSTGAQDCIYLLRHSPARDFISAVILQGAVGDRDILESDPNLREMLVQARDLEARDQDGAFLPDLLYGAPITARRLLSLGQRLSEEDMFSVDLTEEELHSILKVVQIPILMCFSSNDKYVPNPSVQRDLARKMTSVLKASNPSLVDCMYLDGDHALTSEAMYTPFIEYLIGFFKKIS